MKHLHQGQWHSTLYSHILPSTTTLKKASSFNRELNVASLKHNVQNLYPDLARVQLPEPVMDAHEFQRNPEVLYSMKQNAMEYGFGWMHVPYRKETFSTALSSHREGFRQYAKHLFDYFHITSRASIKEKNWMNPAESRKTGNTSFHQDNSHKGFITLVYGGRENIHGGHFQLYNKAQHITYHIPNLDNRFTLVSFRDDESIYHRSTPRIPIPKNPDPNASPFIESDSHLPKHTLLAFRGFQGKREQPFHFEGEREAPHA